MTTTNLLSGAQKLARGYRPRGITDEEWVRLKTAVRLINGPAEAVYDLEKMQWKVRPARYTHALRTKYEVKTQRPEAVVTILNNIT